jgi:hypothetical protein
MFVLRLQVMEHFFFFNVFFLCVCARAYDR